MTGHPFWGQHEQNLDHCSFIVALDLTGGMDGYIGEL